LGTLPPILKNDIRFDIKYIHPYRAGVVFTLTSVGLLFAWVEINKNIQNAILCGFFILTLSAIALSLSWFFVYARLVIYKENENLRIEWLRRLPFNFNKTEIINENKITKLRIDKSSDSNQRAVKIYFKTGTFYINSYDNKYFRADILNFMEYLRNLSKLKSIPIVDQWDEMNERGLLRIAYITNSVILVLAIVACGLFIFFKGFQSRFILFLLPIIPHRLMYNKLMKSKLDKTGGNTG
jgi:hypothetical protein